MWTDKQHRPGTEKRHRGGREGLSGQRGAWSRMEDIGIGSRMTHLLQLRLLCLLVFAGLCGLPVELLCCELWPGLVQMVDVAGQMVGTNFEIEECLFEARHFKEGQIKSDEAGEQTEPLDTFGLDSCGDCSV